MEQLPDRIDVALGAMGAVPRSLRAYLERPGPDFETASAPEIEKLLDLLLDQDPNAPPRLRFSSLLRSWDNAKDPSWTTTARNTPERRRDIHKHLKSDASLEKRIDDLLPFYRLEEPLIIAEKHQDWYAPKSGVRDYYWSKYLEYLRKGKGWPEKSVLSMENSTRAIVECLTNPEASAAYSSRGLVMGYVQSGKTANFTGVIARAADAGYRLIIILAGTWNILRNQTQRRLDKELLGKELLKNDESYTLHPPRDWSEFLEHGSDLAELGHFGWQRLTRPDIDFKRLKSAIDNLEFEKSNKALPLCHPSNLHSLPVKLLVVKKHSGILQNLVRDFKLLQKTILSELPTLIIDDESDQAGLNTAGPVTTTDPERTKTNLRIVELLKLLPRAQYIGYTATPYANALVDIDDPDDLFPKDFIVSLDRADGYMGVSDFFDPLTDYEDLPPDDFKLPEIAFIRRVADPVDTDDEDLKKALRSYVLSGAIKLFRAAADPERYRPEFFFHHTMLVHTSSSRGAHSSAADRLRELWLECAFNSPAGRDELESLWTEDYAAVSGPRGELVPAAFGDLVSHLAEAIKKIETGNNVFLVVNSDSAQAPDFGAEPVWKVIIGGNKLSRGYTVEGLTISYYRRVARSADTVMQMGRWFGFRPGYQDLVRVFLGVDEGKDKTDLVAQFKEVCRLEERFREEIKRYARKPGVERIAPKQIPPLISLSGNLPPTARNKMFNAILKQKNFGGQRSTPTLTAAKPAALKQNLETLRQLLVESASQGLKTLGGMSADGGRVEFSGLVFETETATLVEFLKHFRWLESEYPAAGDRPADINLQIEFLTKENHGIERWLALAPQRQDSFGKPLTLEGLPELKVKKRQRSGGRGFRVFGEPAHRTVAEYLAGIEDGNSTLTAPNAETKSRRNLHQGIIVLYPVREDEKAEVSVGFELLFPENNLGFELGYTVRRKGEQIKVESD